MGKSIETRMGGPNSLKALTKMGFGWFGIQLPNVTKVVYTDYTDNGKKQVVPGHSIIITDLQRGETITFFKPTNKAMKQLTSR